jgi:hypothetical protein
MTDEPIGEDVRQLLRDHIHSYEQLELLVRIAATPADAWSAERAAASVPMPVASAVEALDHLARRGLLAAEHTHGAPRYTLQAEPESQAATVTRLARAYAAQRLDIMNLMSANAVERVRNSALQAFAGAFVFRRKPDA